MLCFEISVDLYKVCLFSGILPQNALRRDFNGKCIELIEGHYLEVVVEV